MGWRETIEENGYAVLPALVSSEHVDRLVQDIGRLSPERGRAGVRHALRLGPVAAIAVDPLLADIACAILGTRSFPFRATLFEKSPVSNWLVVWHQDTALPLRERVEVPGWGPWSVKEKIDYAHAPAGTLSQVLALRIHLDDSSADNGPLKSPAWDARPWGVERRRNSRLGFSDHASRLYCRKGWGCRDAALVGSLVIEVTM